jgi:L-seryl-tRNA(Ser) seleniumtransferase
MAQPSDDPVNSLLRLLPSVDDVLASPDVQAVAASSGNRKAVELVRQAIEQARDSIRNGSFTETEVRAREAISRQVVERVLSSWHGIESSKLERVINATGVLIHTNLGRAPFSKSARKAIAETAAGYCTLEYDVRTGKRGARGGSVESQLCDLTGAEAAVVVNNCAAAAFLVLSAIAKGGDVVVSRGELVEIGGDFRIPDVLAQSGCTLREVGTTNRTKISDYEAAIREGTSMIMRVHPSNYRVIGFTASPSNAELVDLARTRDVVFFEDAGSGALVDLSAVGLHDEPVIRRSIEDGIDIVAFSGDKLLGGPQAGIIVGRSKFIEKIKRNPLYRALRVDKMVYAALEATLDSYMREAHFSEIPVLRMLSASADEIEARSLEFVKRMKDELGASSSLELSLIKGESAVGGGAAPAIQPATVLVAVRHDPLSASQIEERLRSFDPPVIARIEEDQLLLDLRTVEPEDEAVLIEALNSLPAE